MGKRKVIWAVLIVASLAILFFYFKRWIDIDRCLDRGGRWNYETRECEGERKLG